MDADFIVVHGSLIEYTTKTLFTGELSSLQEMMDI